MEKDLYINGEKINHLIAPERIGGGRESEVYGFGCGEVLVLFKGPDYPDYVGYSRDEKDARERLQEMQTKLRAFPADLSNRVTSPEELVTDYTGTKILGYKTRHVMGDHLIDYASTSFCGKNEISMNTIMEIFRDLHQTVSDLHKKGVIIGDFHPDNVMVEREWRIPRGGYGNEAYLIDTHSFQFGDYLCGTFKPKFVDPLLCDSEAKTIKPISPHTQESDWYAYTAMLMQSLVCHPYSGAYRIRNPRKRIEEHIRSLHRITVFHREVVYPDGAVPYSVLSDDLLQFFRAVFEHDLRRKFPSELLELRWKTCERCDTEHTRPRCPVCR